MENEGVYMEDCKVNISNSNFKFSVNFCLIEPVSQSVPAFYQKSLQVFIMITLKRLCQTG